MGTRSSKLGKIKGVINYKRLSEVAAPFKGYVPICVGINDDDVKRFVVQTKALRDTEFLLLLRNSVEEYGFTNDGVLRIPFETKDFEEWMIRRATFKIVRVEQP